MFRVQNYRALDTLSISSPWLFTTCLILQRIPGSDSGVDSSIDKENSRKHNTCTLRNTKQHFMETNIYTKLQTEVPRVNTDVR